MAVKFGKDGTLYCNTVKYNYKQARNLIANSSFGNKGAWGGSGGAAITNHDSSAGTMHGYKTYRAFYFSAGGNPMFTQDMPTPIVGHKYYGCLMWKTTGSTFGATDNRFEWYVADSENGTMVFANKNVATNGNWVKLSAIKSLTSLASSSGWKIRNFLVNSTTTSYASKLMIVDLTDTFGAGNEPSKEWCDHNILEHEKFVNYGNSEPRWHTVDSDAFKSDRLGGFHEYRALSLNSYWEPRDYMLHLTSNSNAEGTVSFTSGTTMDSSLTYYGFYDAQYAHTPRKTTDMYFGLREPALGNRNLHSGKYYCGGGGMAQWKRYSFFNNRSGFSSGSYEVRCDFNNAGESNLDLRMTNICVFRVDGNDGIIYWYNYYLGTNVTLANVNRHFCERWCDGRNSTIIRIKDPSVKTIKFCKGKKINRDSDAGYTTSQLESYKGISRDTWSIGSADNSHLKTGDIAYIQTWITDQNNINARMFVEIISIGTSSVTVNNLGYYTEGQSGYEIESDIQCNDIEIRPEVNAIKMNSTGTIICKKLEKIQDA